MLALLIAALALARAAASTFAEESVTVGVGPCGVLLLLLEPHPAMTSAVLVATKQAESRFILFLLAGFSIL
jgi:hypothetical protein